MRWIRTSLIWMIAATSAGAAVVACSADESPGATTPDASPDAITSDASLPDARDADARPPFEPTDEAITCSGTPCAVDIVAGDTHFCARMNDGTVRCWGSDAHGALGRGSVDPPDAGPDAGWAVSKVSGLSGVAQISAAGATTCARLEEGGIVCWGGNDFGQLGLAIDPPITDFDPHPDPAPVALPAGLVPARVDVGHRTACVASAAGKMACWGSNEEAQLGRPDAGTDPVHGAAFADLGTLAVARAVPTTHTTLVTTPAGELWSWGALAGNAGPLAGRVSSVSPEAIPRRVMPLTGVMSVAASSWIEAFENPEPPPPRAHACAVAAGELYCWGQTYRAALCTGLPDSSRVPARARHDEGAWSQQVAVSDELTCVRMTDGTVECCGEDRRGRLGRGFVADFTSVLSPAAGFTGHAVKVAASNGAVCALVQGGKVECWGDNDNGELGQDMPDQLDHPSPLGVRF